MSPPAPLVVVTRQGDSAGELGAHLRELGARVAEVPLIRFGLPSDPAAVRARLSDLSGVAWLLLTSPQGAKALAELLRPPDLRGVRLAAVGGGTARWLTGAGFVVDFQPAEARGAVLGAELPAQAGKVALHLTSQLSEDALRDVLTARGIGYERAEAYRTETVTPTPAQLELLRGAAAVTLASGSAARALSALAGADFDPLALPVAVMGPQTAAAARAAGFRQVLEAREVSLRGLAWAALSHEP